MLVKEFLQKAITKTRLSNIPFFQTFYGFANMSTYTLPEHMMSKFSLPERFIGNDSSVWVEYGELAAKHAIVDLGQGFPNYYCPEIVKRALVYTVGHPNPLMHQYTRGFGHPRLVNVLAKLYSKLLSRELDAHKEILITCGAYEALYASIQGHTTPGDEWIVIEPFFDCYEPMIRSAGGIPRFLTLMPSSVSKKLTSADWTFDPNELAKLFNEKTKAIILNNPQNPLGKVYSLKELEIIADLAKKWNTLVISDEVYEHLVYEPNKHIRIATLPDMYKRTITIGSAGKAFSITGWKIGWAYGPANLLRNLQVVHQNSVYTCNTPIQEAIAMGFEEELEKLGQPDSYFTSLAKELLPKRDYMAKFLSKAGMIPTIPEGGYFMVANWTPLKSKAELDNETDTYMDYQFTKWMTKTHGVHSIPQSVFYSKENKSFAQDFVRYCFIKDDQTLQEASGILLKWVRRRRK